MKESKNENLPEGLKGVSGNIWGWKWSWISLGLIVFLILVGQVFKAVGGFETPTEVESDSLKIEIVE